MLASTSELVTAGGLVSQQLGPVQWPVATRLWRVKPTGDRNATLTARRAVATADADSRRYKIQSAVHRAGVLRASHDSLQNR